MNLKTKWLLDRWQRMTLIRRTEEAIAEMVEKGEAGCPCHLSIGQEAVAAGVCAALGRQDSVWGGHRSHGHYLAKGGSLTGLLSEVLLKTTGCASGRGGSMQLADRHRGVLGTVPNAGGTVPLAVGAAFAYKMRGEKTVAVAFFGDGAMEEGHVHESMNLAALYRLPLLLVCENNLYAGHMHWKERRAADHIYRAGEYHSIPGEMADGNNVTAVYLAARKAVARARRGGGPTLLECRTFRWRGHVGASYGLDAGTARKGELTEWMAQDPIRQAADHLIEQGVADLGDHERKIAARIEHALRAARRAPRPTAARLKQFVYAESFESHDNRGQAFIRHATGRGNNSHTNTQREAAACAS